MIEGWQDVATCPLDTPVLFYEGGSYFVGVVGQSNRDDPAERWYLLDAYPDCGRLFPTHWMPLPEPPAGDTR